MKELYIVSVVTNEIRYIWETCIYLKSLRDINLSKYANILVYVEKDAFISQDWKELSNEFPEAGFNFYSDSNNINRICQSFRYGPLYRFYVLQQHWKAYPELSNKTIFYTDTDLVFTNNFNISELIQDDTCYLSWTGSKDRKDNYIWTLYLNSKVNSIIPNRLEEYNKLDIVARLAYISGTSKENIVSNDSNTGGAQYLLKNIQGQFWTDCFNTCCEIKMYLSGLNQVYFKGNNSEERENNGFQSFCSDMWALYYTLLKYNKQIRTPIELDFAWSTDRIERLDEVGILHNAGITSEETIKVAFEKTYINTPVFFKGKYLDTTPFKDESLILMQGHELNKQFCNNYYITKILETKEEINWAKK